MHLLWSFVSLSAAIASAQADTSIRRPPPRISSKGLLAVAYPNTTTISNSSTPATRTPLAPPSLPTVSVGSWTSSSTTIALNSTTDTPSCTGSVTYYGTVPPTVYLTVTEGFDVTVTAHNVSVTDTPTLITPLPACQATVIPGASYAPLIPANATAGTAGATRTGVVPQIATASPKETDTPPQVVPAPTQASPVYSSVDYTSTVIVTKKTPVTVVAPSTASVDVSFESVTPVPPPPPPPPPPTTRSTSATPKPGGNNAPADGDGGGNSNSGGAPTPSISGSSGNADGGSNQGSNGGNSNTGGNQNSGGNGGSGNAGGGSNNGGNAGVSGSGGEANQTPNSQSDATSSRSFLNPAGSGPDVATLVGTTSTKLGIGNIIASILNSPFATPAPTLREPGIPVPLTTTVDNVRVVVSSSSVVIGSQTIAIPTAAPTTVQANGATFTVRPSEIVAPVGTITISRVHQNNAATTPVPVQPTTFVTAVGDLTFTVGPTVAILSATTYRIGPDAPATTVTVHGTKVSIGAGGVGLPSTTIAPAAVATSPFVVYTAAGLTFSVDESEAVVVGTTYQIGSEAPQVMTTISGESISFGPGGIGLDSTTIAPTAPSSQTTETKAPSTTASTSNIAASATQSVTQLGSGAAALNLPLSKFVGWHLVAVMLGWLLF